jgi:hypothetical protein
MYATVGEVAIQEKGVQSPNWQEIKVKTQPNSEGKETAHNAAFRVFGV